MFKRIKFLNTTKENIKHFAGIDNDDYQNMMMILQDKKKQIKTIEQIASNYVIKNNIRLDDISFKVINGKRTYGDSKYQEYMDIIEKLRYEIEQIEESHLMKIHNKRR